MNIIVFCDYSARIEIIGKPFINDSQRAMGICEELNKVNNQEVHEGTYYVLDLNEKYGSILVPGVYIT